MQLALIAAGQCWCTTTNRTPPPHRLMPIPRTITEWRVRGGRMNGPPVTSRWTINRQFHLASSPWEDTSLWITFHPLFCNANTYFISWRKFHIWQKGSKTNWFRSRSSVMCVFYTCQAPTTPLSSPWPPAQSRFLDKLNKLNWSVMKLPQNNKEPYVFPATLSQFNIELNVFSRMICFGSDLSDFGLSTPPPSLSAFRHIIIRTLLFS